MNHPSAAHRVVAVFAAILTSLSLFGGVFSLADAYDSTAMAATAAPVIVAAAPCQRCGTR